MKTQLFSTAVEWKSLLNSINDPIFVLDKNYNIIWCNSKSLKVYGYEENEFLNLNINEIRAPYTQNEVEKYLSEYLPKDESVFETRHVKKNGKLVPVQISTKSLKIDDEVFHIHSVRDISNRVKAEDELKKSEKKYKDLVETAPIGIYVQCDGKIVFLNRVAVSLFGAENENDVLGHTIFDFVHPDYYKIFAYRINLLMDGMSSPILEIKTLGLNGKMLDVEVTAKPIVYNGRAAVEVFMNDITIRKRAEYGVNLLASMVESCEDAVVAIDLNGKILYWNKGAERIYGYRQNDVIGKSVSLIHPQSSSNEFPGIIGILKKGGQIDHYSTLRRRKDGGLIKVVIKISPILEKSEITGASEIAYQPDN